MSLKNKAKRDDPKMLAKLQRSAPLHPPVEASKEWEPIPRFRQAVVDVAYYLRRWKMYEGESTPPPQELRAYIGASQLELREAAMGTLIGPPPGPNGMTPEIIKQLKPDKVGILTLFKTPHHIDATAVFRFLHDAMSLSPDLDERDCLAAVDNLDLHVNDRLPAIENPTETPLSLRDDPNIEAIVGAFRESPGRRLPFCDIVTQSDLTDAIVRRLLPIMENKNLILHHGKKGGYSLRT